jgi:hypothetical protein
MEGRLIRAAKDVDCWNVFQRKVWNYWERLAAAGGDRGVIAVAPSFKLDESRRSGEVALGGDFVRGHEPMATSDEVEALFERSSRDGVLVGKPPNALVLGVQKLGIEQDQDGGFALRTTWYKYCLIVRLFGAADAGDPAWLAIRLESDARIGWNSEMYPSLYLHLSDETGCFAPLTQVPGGADVELRTAHADAVKTVLLQGREAKADWHLELERWRKDVDARSECAPELFDLFAAGP